MLFEGPCEKRALRTESMEADMVVVGGGMAGVCAAITAARAGIRVVLVQDRPVLGGNASSEIRMVVLGATSSMGNNNRWAREGGVIDEILVENVYRNHEGHPVLLDALLLEKVVDEPNLTLLLNTAVYEVEKRDAETITLVRGFCSQNSMQYELRAPLFCDASGDGVVGFLAGAAFRMGAESKEEFGERFAPDAAYGELLGHTIYFYSKDAGRPVRFVPPSFALKDITRLARHARISPREHGRQLWWVEYGGRLDTVHDTESIKWELWSVVYGIWNYIKNSGNFPEAESLVLDWVGTIPGKRESRRFEGDFIITQRDVIERRAAPDTVSYGGWALDLHPADGIYSERPPCNQWHSKGIYPVPYRTLYSRNIRNLFLAGRIISASHVAFGSTRVMATCAQNAQAVGMAAAFCRREGLLPADLVHEPWMGRLQRALQRTGQYLPGIAPEDPEDLARKATLSASSRLRLKTLPPDGPLLRLDRSWAMLLPVPAGPAPRATFLVNAAEATTLHLELRTGSRLGEFTPDVTLAHREVSLAEGKEQHVTAEFDVALDEPRYVFYCLMQNPAVEVRCTQARLTGVLAVVNRGIGSVTEGSKQAPAEDVGVETFEFWRPLARPAGHNLALALDPPIDVFPPEAVINGLPRPTSGPNAWVADQDDRQATLTLQWPEPVTIGRVDLALDTDLDNPLFSVLSDHPEAVMPFCIRRWRLLDGTGRVLDERSDNHQTRNTIRLDVPIITKRLQLEVDAPSKTIPAAVFEIRCYPP